MFYRMFSHCKSPNSSLTHERICIAGVLLSLNIEFENEFTHRWIAGGQLFAGLCFTVNISKLSLSEQQRSSWFWHYWCSHITLSSSASSWAISCFTKHLGGGQLKQHGPWFNLELHSLVKSGFSFLFTRQANLDVLADILQINSCLNSKLYPTCQCASDRTFLSVQIILKHVGTNCVSR